MEQVNVLVLYFEFIEEKKNTEQKNWHPPPSLYFFLIITDYNILLQKYYNLGVKNEVFDVIMLKYGTYLYNNTTKPTIAPKTPLAKWLLLAAPS